ncbi:MAG TPA: FkbM family methyltransferase [Humisphaera sp.]|jgi:FkbM family methyltransferase|nr:FkbM family methyltransferase [Humisphaera sp.]
MLNSLRHWMIERLRCAKHNWLDGVSFRVGYRGGIYEVRTEDGLKFRFPFNPYTSFYEIGGYLAEGEWELEPGMWVIDAGGERGEFALYAARKVGSSGGVIMLEPDPQSRAIAEQAFAANGGKPDNLVVLSQGLWSKPGTLKFAAGLGGSSVLVDAGTEVAASAKSAGATMMDLEVHSLQSLVESLKLPRLDFVKMDIEGAEIEAVEGSGTVLEQFKPRLAIASYHIREGKKTSELLEPLFRQHHYQTRTGFPGHPTTYGWPADGS